MFSKAGILLVACCVQMLMGQDDDFLYDVFPDGFKWGCATSSYQVEGAWDVDGKGENIWDNFTHGEGRIEGDDTGDVACNSYYQYEEDVQLLVDLGVNFYRFSLSWARILPDGEGEVNQLGIDYYNSLIDELLANGLEPMITLYHWDLPQALQDRYGGWEGEELAQIFADFARVCFQNFGDRVKWWITLNEPWVVAYQGYEYGVFAPGVFHPGTGAYESGHTLIKAHAEAWHVYNDEFRAEQQGNISITLNANWKEPLTDSAEDLAAAERAINFELGWFAHAIFVNGDYSDVQKDQVARKSEQEGLDQSRLPEFTEEEKQRILGTWDFLGANHYTTILIEDNPHNRSVGGTFTTDQETRTSLDEDWPRSGSIWLNVVPWGMRRVLNYIKDNYGNPPVIITENGVSDRNGTLNDVNRIAYFRDYINNVLKAVKLDGCQVVGYTGWSLMDNFEWIAGYAEKFGIHQVDFDDDARPRTPKDSAAYYSQIVADNGFPEPELN